MCKVSLNPREVVLATPIGDILNDLKEGMDTANRFGNLVASVEFAIEINYLNKIIDACVEVERDTGLYSES